MDELTRQSIVKLQKQVDELTEKFKLLSGTKPILLIGFPQVIGVEGFERDKKSLPQFLKDEYHLLCYMSPFIEDFTFQVFYEKDFNTVKYEELKQIIENLHNQIP